MGPGSALRAVRDDKDWFGRDTSSGLGKAAGMTGFGHE
jgi:hypothetical protein